MASSCPIVAIFADARIDDGSALYGLEPSTRAFHQPHDEPSGVGHVRSISDAILPVGIAISRSMSAGTR
jgi:hypothetical protein